MICPYLLTLLLFPQMHHSRMDQKIRNVLFEPHLTQLPKNSEVRLRETTSGTHLGVVVDHLISATAFIHAELPSIDLLLQKMSLVKEMSSADLKAVNW